VAQAEKFIEQIREAKRSGKPVAAWVKVYHKDPLGASAEQEQKLPGVTALMTNFITASQFEALWFHLKFEDPKLTLSEGAKSIVGIGELGTVTREATQFLYSRLFPSGLPQRYEELTEEQKNFLLSPGAVATAFGEQKIEIIYPAGDPSVLDNIDAKLDALKASYGRIIPQPWPEEYRSLVMDQREEALVAYARALISKPEHADKVVVIDYGTKHSDLPARLRDAGFEVVTLDCGTVLDSFLKNLSEKVARGEAGLQ
jgi:hypothetical protein